MRVRTMQLADTSTHISRTLGRLAGTQRRICIGLRQDENRENTVSEFNWIMNENVLVVETKRGGDASPGRNRDQSCSLFVVCQWKLLTSIRP